MAHEPHPLIALIDDAVKLASDNSFRDHLGGSMIGRACEREIWYGFRHASRPDFDGRMLRLFGRGHLEEPRFVKYLEMLGATVYEFAQCLWWSPVADEYLAFDWDHDHSGGVGAFEPTKDPYHIERAAKRGVVLKQWRILDVDGHFGGSLDGIATNIPTLTSDCMLEFKTHGDKSFKKLIESFQLHGHGDGLKHAKPEHYGQVQVYMHKRGLKHTLYFAVNKNDEHLHVEYIAYDRAYAETLIAKAVRIVHSKTPPRRIGSGRPSWFDCKYCTHKGVCHSGEPMLKSCRSCRFVSPGPDGTWHCSKWGGVVPKDFMKKGCDQYLTIHD